MVNGRALRRWFLRLVSAGLAVPIAYMVGVWIPQIIDAPHLALNVRAQWLAPRAAEVSQDVSLVRITDAALEGRPYVMPLDRDYLAEVIQATAAYGPRMILLDFVFDRPTEPDKDARFIEALNAIDTPIAFAVTETGVSGGRATMTRARMEACAATLHSGGACQSFQDDFIARTVLMNSAPRLRAYGFPTVLESRESDADDFIAAYIPPSAPGGPCSLSDLAAREGTNFDCERSESRLIAWLLPPKSSGIAFHSIDSTALLSAPRTQAPLNCDPRQPSPIQPDEVSAAEWLRTQQIHCRIVVLGGDLSFQDRHMTPISSIMGGNDKYIAGLEIHAQAIQQNLDSRTWYEFKKYQVIIFLILCGIIGSFIREFKIGRVDTKFTIIIFFYLVVVLDIILFSMTKFIVPGLSIIIPSLVGAFTCFVSAFISFFLAEIGENDKNSNLSFLKDMLT